MYVLEQCGDYGAFLEFMDEETRSCPKNQSQSRDLEGASIDTTLLMSLDTCASRHAKLVSRSDSGPEDPRITRLLMTNFKPNIGFSIVLGKRPSLHNITP